MSEHKDRQTRGTPASSVQAFSLHALIAIGLVALVFISFLPALSAELLRYDDQILITNNPAYRGLAPANIHWMFTNTTLGHYQPLTWVSYALDYSLWGMNPQGYHLTNVLLHAVNAVLVFVLALRLLMVRVGRDARFTQTTLVFASAITAALFAVHPLRVESVAWVTERRDVLSAAFLLGAAIVYLRAFNIGKPGIRNMPMYAVCVVLLALSLLSKAWGMSFFVLMLIVDWYPLGRLRPATWLRDSLRLIAEKIPMIVLGLAAAAIAGHAQNTAMAAKTIEQWGVAERVVQAFYGLAFYVQKTLWPFDLSPLYQLPKHVDPFEPRYLAAYALVFAGIAAALALIKRAPAILAAALVYGVCVAPVLGVFQSGDQFVADRYSYLACIPFAMLIAAAGLKLAEHSGKLRPVLIVAAGVVVIALSVLTSRQAQHWRDTESLWRQAIAAEPGAMAWTNLGLELDYQKRREEAITAFYNTVQLDKTDGRAWYSMANALRNLKHFPEAEAAYKQAIEYLPQRYIPMVNLASLYINDLHRPREAVELCRQAVADVEAGGRRPLSAMPYLALGQALAITGDRDGARAAYTKALDFAETRKEAEAKLKELDEQRAK